MHFAVGAGIFGICGRSVPAAAGKECHIFYSGIYHNFYSVWERVCRGGNKPVKVAADNCQSGRGDYIFIRIDDDRVVKVADISIFMELAGTKRN